MTNRVESILLDIDFGSNQAAAKADQFRMVLSQLSTHLAMDKKTRGALSFAFRSRLFRTGPRTLSEQSQLLLPQK